LNLSHQDPADRFLVATAVVYDLKLVTSDEKLLGAKHLPVIANN
jgi:PIN domain nuclease of toxin-antitoxin system